MSLRLILVLTSHTDGLRLLLYPEVLFPTPDIESRYASQHHGACPGEVKRDLPVLLLAIAARAKIE